MSVIGLDHVQLAMPAGGEGEARRFFLGVLGMQEVAKPAGLSPSGCWFEASSLKLHLGVDADFRPARKAHVALLVDDLEQVRAKLSNAQCEVQSVPQISGYHRFFTQDPFGNRIEIMQIV